MKNIRVIKLNKTCILGLLLILTFGCERDVTDDAVPATFNSNGEIFLDNPVGLTDEFFESFDPAEGYNVEDTFEVVDDESFEGSSSIRIDVPSSGNPNGFLAGGIFRDRGDGRDLTGFDALTFWAKASTTGTVASFGFGVNFEGDEFSVVKSDTEITTNWTKYIIPIPDPSKLIQERGLFSYIAAPIDVMGDGPNGNEVGWTFWLDDIRFENLGTIGQERPQIFDGEDIVQEAFVGSDIPITGLGYKVNLASGINQTISPSENYFTFMSSDTSVATVSESGVVSVIGDGTATITARIGDFTAEGSLELTADGAFVNADDPTLPASEVLSIYSDTYSNQGGLNVGAFNNSDISISTQLFAGNEHIVYENLQFVGVGWDTPVDISSFTHVHVDVQLTTPGSTFIVELLDFGPDGIDNGFGDGSAGGFNATSQLIQDQWIGLDIPISSFTNSTGGGGTGLTTFNDIGFIIFVSNNGSVLIDNVYFYTN
ncbi:Ig-like domain (group 2) [Formosa sp. Hel1_31_208]|uniref:Ig-like domain-containing protein n=1 Tax=Formosa sp. Hel1_31_208 TaxID=1798225 RepID=UPI00087B4ACF|nr:Ig-like domain-containing protein [Formosa sp. Hel1_31_208]SDS23743.1 Ig-like domain (group 2) [Formosa sp. Hel1_31_208]